MAFYIIQKGITLKREKFITLTEWGAEKIFTPK